LDDKHDAKKARVGRHCFASFSSGIRRLQKRIVESWGEIVFDCIVLDYFFMPVSYIHDAWKERFFPETLPFFASSGLLKVGGQVWLPYLKDVANFLSSCSSEIALVYNVELVADVTRNPLYSATEMCEDRLLEVRGAAIITNTTQMEPLYKFSATPFCLLEVHAPVEAPITHMEINIILVRVCIGYDKNPQRKHFMDAAESVKKHFTEFELVFECLSVYDIAVRNWGPNEVINWLLGSDIHVILTHLHQFLTHWDFRGVAPALERLSSHLGFPSGSCLRCPVFQQDKYRYIQALPSAFTIPTLKIEINAALSDRDAGIQALQYYEPVTNFMRSHTGFKGWVLKLPYRTMSKGVKFTNSSVDAVIEQLHALIREYGGMVPYLMLQPQLVNRQEYGIVVLNGNIAYEIEANALRVGEV
jgi:hypothetical protein